MKILIVDKNEIMHRIIHTMMHELFGDTIDITAVSEGNTALSKIRIAHDRGKPFSLIIADWQIEGINGLTLYRKIATRKKRKRGTVEPFILLVDRTFTGVEGHWRKKLIPPVIIKRPFYTEKLGALPQIQALKVA